MKNWVIKNRFILVLSAWTIILRIPGIFDGLPAVFNPSEYFLSKIALSMGARLSPDPGFYGYPPFFSYFLLILYGGYYLLGHATGIFPDTEALAVKFLVDPDIFYILGRSASLLFMLVTVLLT